MSSRSTLSPRVRLLAGSALLSATLAFAGLPALAPSAAVAAPWDALTGGHPQSFADLVEKVSPAVVTISANKQVRGVSRDFPVPPGPLGEMLRRFGMQGPPGDDQEGPGSGQGGPGQMAHALGSGFVIDPAGYIVTNRHVIEGADEVQVTFQDNKQITAKVVGEDEKTDLALLKVEAKTALPALQWGDSDKLRVGDWVVAVGNPFALGSTVTAGILSARGRDLSFQAFDDFLQIDAPINRGNSGGPSFNANGEVIGINTAIYSPNGGSVGIGFAIPSNLAKPILAQLKQSGKIDRGWLGVALQPITPEISEGLGLADDKGALVASVEPDSPAAKAGLKSGDVVQTVNGSKVASAKDLARAVAMIAPGKPADLGVWRSGQSRKVAVTVGNSAEHLQVAAAEGGAPGKGEAVHGLALATLDDHWRERLHLDASVKGAVVLKASAGVDELQPGDVIQTVDNEPVATTKDVASRLDKAKASGRKSALLLINRGGDVRFVPLPLKA